MDRFIRLTLWFLVGVFIAAAAIPSFAASCPVNQGPGYQWKSSACPSSSRGPDGFCWYSAPSGVVPDACAAFDGASCDPSIWSVSGSGSYYQILRLSTVKGSIVQDTTSCTCPTGTVVDPSSGLCVAPPCTSGETLSSGFYDMGTSPTAMPQHSGCDGGCGTSFNGTFPVSRALVGGVYHYFGQGSFVKDGSTCSTGSPSPTSAGSSTPAPTCASGQSMGQVNGQTVCLGSGGTPTNPNASPAPNTKTTTPTVSNPDGSTTQTSTQQNADGSTTTTTTNTAPDGTVTTSSNTVNADGTPQDPMKGFCQENPSSPMCKGQDAFCQANPNSIMCKDHTFSGSCAATSCSGDAIECAIAQEQAKRNCVLFDTTTPLSDLGNSLASGADPQQSAISTMLAGTSTDVQAVFTTAQGSRWLGSSDIPDVNITALGHSYVIPMANWSNLFRVLGYILVSVSLVIAVRMVSSTVTA